MRPIKQTCRADELRAGDLATCPHPDGRALEGRVANVARVKIAELTVAVNRLTVTYPGVDAVVVSLFADGGTHTLDLRPDQSVTRETVNP